MKFHGKPHAVTWTKLSECAEEGQNKLQVVNSVDWKIGMSIVVTPTAYDLFQVEEHVISDIHDGGRTIVTRENLQFKHVCETEVLESEDSYTQCAEVGLLTRNIKISGLKSDDFYGGRLVVGYHTLQDGDNWITYRGIQRTLYTIHHSIIIILKF